MTIDSLTIHIQFFIDSYFIKNAVAAVKAKSAQEDGSQAKAEPKAGRSTAEMVEYVLLKLPRDELDETVLKKAAAASDEFIEALNDTTDFIADYLRYLIVSTYYNDLKARIDNAMIFGKTTDDKEKKEDN